MLVYRYAPAGSRVLPAWRACPATPAGLAGAVPASGPRLPAFRDGATCETRPVWLHVAVPDQPHQPEIVPIPFRSQSVIGADIVAFQGIRTRDNSQRFGRRNWLSLVNHDPEEDKRANDRRPFTRPSGYAFGDAGSGWRARVEDHDGADHRCGRDHLRSGHDEARAGHRCCYAAFHAVLRRGVRAHRADRVGRRRPGGDGPDRHDPGTQGDGPGRAPGRLVRRTGLPGHPHRDRDPGAAGARNRRVHPLLVAVSDFLHQASARSRRISFC